VTDPRRYAGAFTPGQDVTASAMPACSNPVHWRTPPSTSTLMS